jgi:hypothetical protein
MSVNSCSSNDEDQNEDLNHLKEYADLIEYADLLDYEKLLNVSEREDSDGLSGLFIILL